MPWVGFERTITGSERAKTVHALDRSATVTGNLMYLVVCISVITIIDVLSISETKNRKSEV
jgi:hypothetical protein